MRGGLFADFLEVSRPRLARGTYTHYDRALRRFLVFVAERNPQARRLTVDLLTRDAIESWFGALVADKLAVSSARLLVTAVVSAWTWAYDSDTYGDLVRRPRRIDMPTPVGAPARAPTWAEMDQAIWAAYRLAEEARAQDDRAGWTWRARLATLLRYTGMRVNEQAMAVRWDDVDLERAELTIRGELGKSQAERSGRIVPMSPHLVRAMEGWGRREGFVIAPERRSRYSPACFLNEVWAASKVAVRVWGVGPGRLKGQAQHAFRKGFKTGLSRLGVERDIRDFLLGHHRGIDANYIEVAELARDAVALIPEVGQVPPDNVERADPARRQK